MARTVKYQVRRYSSSGSVATNTVVFAGSAVLTTDVGGFTTFSTNNANNFFWTHFIIVPDACDVRDGAFRASGTNRVGVNFSLAKYDNIRIIPDDVSVGDAMTYMTGDSATTDPATGKYQDFRVMWVERHGADSKKVYLARGKTNYAAFGVQ